MFSMKKTSNAINWMLCTSNVCYCTVYIFWTNFGLLQADSWHTFAADRKNYYKAITLRMRDVYTTSSVCLSSLFAPEGGLGLTLGSVFACHLFKRGD